MSKILLTTLNSKYIHLNLAIRMLYDLNHERANIDWAEFTIKNDTNEIATYCAAYDIVCFSCYIWNITPTLKVCHAIKEKNPNTKILLGGPEVSYDWNEVIVRDEVDYIITGEGEVPFEAFVTHFPDLKQVPNIVYKEDFQIKYNKQNVDFDVKRLEGRNPYQYDDPAILSTKVAYIETSRGCPYKCEFCLASLDNSVRYLPMNTIKNNLKYLMQHGKTIKFLDRTFNIKKDFTIDLFQFILEHHKPNNVFQFEITADIIHPDIIQFVNAHVPKGLFRFEIGIQTTNKESNLAVSRKQNFAKTAQVIKQLDDVIDMHLDLIVGLPLEPWESLKESFENTFKLYAPELQFGFLKFLKGTPMREKYEQYGYVFDPNPPYQIIKSNFLSEDELHQMTLLEGALEIYWNKKRLPLTLKYITQQYSIFDTLLQMGIYFDKKSSFFKHTLKDIFQLGLGCLKEMYPNDTMIPQLVALDYYLFHKIKPQDIYHVELETAEKNSIINHYKLDHHNKRFAIIPLSFQLNTFLENETLIHKKSLALFTFDGKQKARLEMINLLAENISGDH